MNAQDKAIADLYFWLKRNYPALVRSAEKRFTSGGGMGDASPAAQAQDVPWYKQIISAVADAIPVAAAYQTQKKLIQLNIQRAKQGLPPVDTAAQVKVGVDDSTKWIVVGGIGLLAIILLMRKG